MALLLQCGPAATADKPPRSLITPIAALIERSAPAQFVYHPSEPAQIRKRGALDDRSELGVGDDGERWLFGPQEGNRAVAAQLAPEPLVDFAKTADGWLFAGESGTLFRATEPLGPFSSAHRPPEPLARLALSRAGVIGITQRGQLVLSRDGAGPWRRSQLVAPPAGAPFFFSLAMLDSGRALALSTPETLWLSEDAGATFRALTVVSSGATRVEVRGQDLVVFGRGRARRLAASDLEPYAPAPSTRAPSATEPKAVFSPDAGAAREGRAAFYRSELGAIEYVEVRGEGPDASLLWGRAGRPLQRRRLAKRCGRYFIAAQAERWWLWCAERDEPHTVISVAHSDDRGQHFGPWAKFWGDASRLKVAAAGGDAVLAIGLCREVGAGETCEPHGLHRLTGGRLDYVPLTTARSEPVELAASPDGTQVASLVFEEKNGPQLLVSQDGGLSFTSSSQPLRTSDRPSNVALLRQWVLDMSIDDAGYASIVMAAASRRGIYVLGHEPGGRQATSAFVDAVTAGSYGSRVVAYVVAEGGGAELVLSYDSGRSFAGAGPLPSSLCPDDDSSDCAVQCHPGGCVLQDRLSLVGWQPTATTAPAVFPVDPKEQDPSLSEPSWASTIVCQFGEDSEWQDVVLDRAPGAGEMALGALDWFAAETRSEPPQVLAHEARSGVVTQVPLFGSKRVGGAGSAHAVYQVEGLAALRRFPGKPTEVAYRNYLRPSAGQVALPPEPARSTAAERPLLSIADDGLFAGPTAVFGDPIFYVAPSGAVLPSWRWPPAQVAGARFDMARIDGQSRAFGVLGEGSVVLRVDSPGAAPHAQTVGIPGAELFGLNQRQKVAYAGDALGVHLEWVGPQAPSARIYPLMARGDVFGPGVLVPNQGDTGGRVAPCSAAMVAKTPRVVAAADRRVLHPVIVVDVAEKHKPLITRDAVMHGTPDAPCIAAFEARGRSGSGYLAMIALEPGLSSWLFRRTAREKATSLRAMTCAEDAGLAPPSDLEPIPWRRDLRD